MNVQAVEKETKRAEVARSESDRLEELRNEASEIGKLVAAGTITHEEGMRRIQQLLSQSRTFSFRAFGF